MMFLDRHLHYLLKPDNARSIPKLDRYLHYTKRRVQHFYTLYANQPEAGQQQMMLLSTLLDNADIPRLLQYDSLHDAYIHGILDQVETLVTLFDPTKSTQINQHGFVQSSHRSSSIHNTILPVQSRDHYPFTQDWSAWQHLRPLRLVDVQSQEWSTLVYFDDLTLRRDPPPYVVVTLDTVGLILKYLSYCHYSGREYTQDNVQEFLHREIVLPCLLEDDLEQWILTQYTRIVQYPQHPIEIVQDSSWQHNSNVRLGDTFRDCFESVRQIVNTLPQHTSTVPRLLASFKLPFRHDVSHFYHQLQTQTELPYERRYAGYAYLKSSRYYDLFISAMALDPYHPEIRSTLALFYRDLEIFTLSKPTAHIYDPHLASMIKTHLTDLTQRVQTLLHT